MDLIAFVVRHFKRLFAGAVIAGILSMAFALTLPNRYLAQAQLALPRGGGMLSMLAAGGDFGLGLGAALGSSTDRRFYERLATSRTIADAILKKFDLLAVFGSPTMVAARQALSKRLIVDVQDDVIRLSYKDTDPNRAAEVCNEVVAQVQGAYLRLKTSKAHLRRVFLERRLREAASDLKNAEEFLRKERLSTRVVEPKEQAKVTLEVAGRVLVESYAAHAQLEVLQLSSRPGSGEVGAVKAKIEALRKQLAQLDSGLVSEGSASASSSPPSVALLPLARLPELELRLSRAMRQVAIYEQIFGLVTKEYEAARIEEVADFDKIPVIDLAVVPDRKVSPSRLMLTLLGALLGMLFVAAHAGMQEGARYLQRTSPERARALVHSGGRLARFFGFEHE